MSVATSSLGNSGQGSMSSTDTGTMASRDSDGDHENGVVDVAGTATGNALAAEVSGMCVWSSNG